MKLLKQHSHSFQQLIPRHWYSPCLAVSGVIAVLLSPWLPRQQLSSRSFSMNLATWCHNPPSQCLSNTPSNTVVIVHDKLQPQSSLPQSDGCSVHAAFRHSEGIGQAKGASSSSTPTKNMQMVIIEALGGVVLKQCHEMWFRSHRAGRILCWTGPLLLRLPGKPPSRTASAAIHVSHSSLPSISHRKRASQRRPNDYMPFHAMALNLMDRPKSDNTNAFHCRVMMLPHGHVLAIKIPVLSSWPGLPT